MQLDIGIVLVLLGFIDLMLAVVLAYAWKVSSRGAVPGQWALGFGFICLGQILFSLFGILPFPILPPIFFLMHILGAESIVRGCGVFLDKPITLRKSSGIVLVGILATTVAGFPRPNGNRAFLVGSLVLSLFFLRAAFLFYRHSDPALGSMRKGTAVSLLSLFLLEFLVSLDFLLPDVPFLINRPVILAAFYSFLLTGLALTLLQLGYTRFHEQLRIKAREKELLLREMHHRTKNNLALVASMISLESYEFKDETVQKAFSRLQGKIRSIAAFHQELQNSGAADRVRADEYLGRVASTALLLSEKNSGISLALDIEPLEIPASEAVSVGLIVNELVTNARKYAFPDNRKGSIHVSLRKSGNGLKLVISDDGIGMVSPPGKDSLGLSLVKNLASQLRGELRFEPGPGTKAVLEFPV